MIEGKTKVIEAGPRDATVVLRTKDLISAGDAARVAEISGAGAYRTQQAANAFGVVNNAGVATSFIERHNEHSLLCWDCEMIPLECVIRRFAFGSYLKRNPEFKDAPNSPVRFDELVVEFFHKHTLVGPPAEVNPRQIDESQARDLYLHDGKWQDGVHTDPYIELGETRWGLHSAKAPVDAANPILAIDPVISADEIAHVRDNLLIPAFTALENAWKTVETKAGPIALVDCKLEVGRRRDNGQIVIADVIDNDSWRIWPGEDPANQLDKQCFRDNEPLSKVESNYQLVTELTDRLLGSSQGCI